MTYSLLDDWLLPNERVMGSRVPVQNGFGYPDQNYDTSATYNASVIIQNLII